MFLLSSVNNNEPGHEKTCLMSNANNKGADQPAHPRSLISAFVVRCLDSVMSLASVIKISSLRLASVAEQASLSLTWSETPKDTISYDEALMYFVLSLMLRTMNTGRRQNEVIRPLQKVYFFFYLFVNICCQCLLKNCGENVSSVLFITDYTSYQVHMPTMFPLFPEIRVHPIIH